MTTSQNTLFIMKINDGGSIIAYYVIYNTVDLINLLRTCLGYSAARVFVCQRGKNNICYSLLI